MNTEYDFSKGERGKFYNAQAEFIFPIYLEPDIFAKMEHLAAENGVDVQVLVNTWLRANLKLVESIQQTG
jgi:hypothetical protein